MNGVTASTPYGFGGGSSFSPAPSYASQADTGHVAQYCDT
ncbi:hypothetical protein FHT76_007218 [Rhizobium sp. BK176]|nr:hypothetical protein [Rhizobium sp. BK176]